MGGLMDYKARFYSSGLGRFIQPDTLTPSGPQGLNRYSYTLNNPIRYNDPSGHRSCDYEDDNGNCKAFTNADYKKAFKTEIKSKFDWKVDDDFSLKELETIYQTGNDILAYANSVTGSNGLDWMHSAFGNTTIEHGYASDGHSDAMPFYGESFGPRIRLDQNWLTHWWGAKVVFAHELGHVWDISSGLADSGKMNSDLGGSSWCYFCSPGSDVPQWNSSYHKHNGDAYGNSGRNEYFAEAFAATVYNPNDTPLGVSSWIEMQTSVDLIEYLVPGGVQ